MNLTYTKLNIILIFCLVLCNLEYINGKDTDTKDARLDKEMCKKSRRECDGRCWCHDRSKPTLKKCDSKTLDFSCVCSTGYIPANDPNVYFSVLVHKCNLALKDCQEKCGDEKECNRKCKDDHNCLTDAQRNPDSDLCNGVSNSTSKDDSILDDLLNSGTPTALGFSLVTTSLVAFSLLINQIA